MATISVPMMLPPPATVVDDHLLAEAFGQFGGDQPRGEFVGPARREGNNEPHRSMGISIGSEDGRRKGEQECPGQQGSKDFKKWRLLVLHDSLL